MVDDCDPEVWFSRLGIVNDSEDWAEEEDEEEGEEEGPGCLTEMKIEGKAKIVMKTGSAVVHSGLSFLFNRL